MHGLMPASRSAVAVASNSSIVPSAGFSAR